MLVSSIVLAGLGFVGLKNAGRDNEIMISILFFTLAIRKAFDYLAV